MKTILEKLAALKDPQALVGREEWERERWTKKEERKGKKKLRGKSLRSCLMCWGEIYRNDLPGSFEIHKVINSCSAFSRAKQKWGYAVICTEVKRKEKKPSQIGLLLRLFLQRLLQLAQPLKKWPSTDDLEESSGCFSPMIHFLLSSWRGIQVHGCWFTLWPLTGIPPLPSPPIKRSSRLKQRFDSCPQTRSYLRIHLLCE